MARNEIEIAAPVEAVWGTLVDAWSYVNWVVGNQRVRHVDVEWPAVGSSFHHTIGIGLLRTRDRTTILRCDPPRLLELDAHMSPLGSALVRMRLDDNGAGGTRVVMEEQPRAGLARRLDSPPLQAATRLRNARALVRLKEVVEQRARRR